MTFAVPRSVIAIPVHRRQRNAALSGPISGGDQAANVQAFRDAAAVLMRELQPTGRGMAWAGVHSPVDLPGTQEAAAESRAMIAAGLDYTTGPLYRRIYRLCMQQVLIADVVFMLPGWERAHGALGEYWLATRSGIPTLSWDEDPTRRLPVERHVQLV